MDKKDEIIKLLHKYGQESEMFEPFVTEDEFSKLAADIVKLFAISDVMPRFEIDYTFTDRTDANIYKEIIQAETGEEALNELHRKHNYKIEWRTIKKLNVA